MGLDQYGFARKGEETIEVMYWRKHANLHGWMESLYRKRGGTGEFNCEQIKLESSDLDQLQNEHRTLKEARGFFWGVSDDYNVGQTEEFIDKARALMAEGYDIYYDSWW
tara:strand:- start:10 stop:336 length:327 start_codon:yes stop_codon:yes gene_type:complete